jgi:hypothetical protein
VAATVQFIAYSYEGVCQSKFSCPDEDGEIAASHIIPERRQDRIKP